MEGTDIDFEGGAGTQPAANADTNPANQEDTTSLDGGGTEDVTGKSNENQGQEAPDTKPEDNANEGEKDNANEESGLEAGTQIEFDGQTYTVATNGDIVDSEGNVFKEAKDVQSWLDENNTVDTDENGELSIDAIREAVGIDVTDESGKPMDFDNTPAGVRSYVESVIALKSNEIQQGTINKLFNDNPLLKQFIDYVQLTGTPRGFGDIPDRSGIQLDKDNPEQLKAVIRMAAQEFGNASLNESYIKYLQDSGALYDEAKNQLQALVGKDQAYRQEIEQRAEAARQQEAADIQKYWEGVNDAINKRVIGGYKLPESFVKNINGQKVTLTPNDFYNYVAVAREGEDGTRMTGYQRDLDNLSNEEALNRELLDAWLMFTGGSYKDLVNMAVNEEKVRKLVVKSKQQRNARTIKVNKPKQSKVNPDEILLS
jgi:hypothetical protein